MIRSIWIILIILFVMFYFISPYDLIPDFFGLLGRVDDFALIGWLIWFIRRILSKRRGTYYQYQKQWSTGANTWQSQRVSDYNKETVWEDLKDNSNGRYEKDYKQHMAAESSEQKIEDPYVVLNVSPNASKEEIKKAYKELLKKYHPDKVAHLGEEFQKIAHKKIIEIQKAYEMLMKG